MNVRNNALKLAKKGFPIIPLFGTDEKGKCLCGDEHCKSPGKHPINTNGIKEASTDESYVEANFNGKPQNIGVQTGEPYEGGYLVVLDVDTKKGKDGTVTLEGLTLINGELPSTFTVRTPTGGLHYYFISQEPTACSSGRLGEGLDVRGVGGYVVSPLSSIGGQEYTVINKNPPSQCPQWLEEAMGKPRERDDRNDDLIGEQLDTKGAVRRAIEHAKSATPAIEGSNGDTTTFRIAADLFDFGLSIQKAHEILCTYWNPRCAPPWDFDELLSKVENAYNYRSNNVGSKSPLSDFDVVDEADLPPPPQRNLSFMTFDTIEPVLDTPYLVEDVIDQQAMSVLYGPSNAGKTFVMLDLAYHIATGRKWANKRIQKGAVLYVALEGGRGIKNRIAALKSHYNDKDVPLAIVTANIDMRSSAKDAKALAKLAEEVTAHFDLKTELIVIDTLSRALAGGNENGPEDMTALVNNCDILRLKSKAHVCLVHHTGKDKDKGARGHSSLRAATDTEIMVDGANGKGKVKFTKQREMEMVKPIAFRLNTVNIGNDLDGQPVTSCTVVKSETSAQEDFMDEHKLGDPKLVILWEAIEKFLIDNERDNIKFEHMFELCEELNSLHNGTDLQFSKSEDTDNRKTAYRRLYGQLTDKGLLRKVNKNQWVAVDAD